MSVSVSVGDSNSNISVSNSNSNISDSKSYISNISDKVDMIMRQTDYTKTTAEEKLAEYKDDATQVIRAYLNGGKTITPSLPKLSTNQQIYKEIRGMMDDAALNYQLKKAKEAEGEPQ